MKHRLKNNRLGAILAAFAIGCVLGWAIVEIAPLILPPTVQDTRIPGEE